MRVYEVLFIVAPNTEEGDIATLITQFSDVITNQGLLHDAITFPTGRGEAQIRRRILRSAPLFERWQFGVWRQV